jgi:hypothetical protein
VRTTQSQARDDVLAVLNQTKVDVSEQVSQIRSASVEAVNLVAAHVDAQLKVVLDKAEAMERQALSAIGQIEHDIAAKLDMQIEQIERNLLVTLQQLHKEVTETLKSVGAFINEGLDRLYARADDEAAHAIQESRTFTTTWAIVGARSVLSVAFVILLLRVASQIRNATSASGDKVPPIAGGVVLLGILILLFAPSLLANVLHIPAVSPPPNVCADALDDYVRFVNNADSRTDNLAITRNNGLTLQPSDLRRLAAVTVQEELQRCSYVSVSEDRIAEITRLMAGVHLVLGGLDSSVATVSSKAAGKK